MTDLIQKGLDILRRRKRAYVSTFGVPGSPGFVALTHLSRACFAFENEVVHGDHDKTLIRAGMRQAFFIIYNHLHLEPDEIRLYRASITAEGDE